jgi:hypothetical protein
MPASHFDVKSITGRPKFIVRHSTLERKPGHGGDKSPAFPLDVLWIAFSIPPGSLSLVKYPVQGGASYTRTREFATN